MTPKIVVIGASAGGITAVGELLTHLGRYPVPMALVLHIGGRVNVDYEPIFGGRGTLAKEAEEKELLEPGWLHVAPAGYHMLVEADGTVSLSVDAPVRHSRPSIDVLFESSASAFGAAVLAVLLTGANDDGAAGVAAVRRAGGRVAIQNPAGAERREMPDAGLAALAGRPDCVGNLREIATWLQERVRS